MSCFPPGFPNSPSFLLLVQTTVWQICSCISSENLKQTNYSKSCVWIRGLVNQWAELKSLVGVLLIQKITRFERKILKLYNIGPWRCLKKYQACDSALKTSGDIERFDKVKKSSYSKEECKLVWTKCENIKHNTASCSKSLT